MRLPIVLASLVLAGCSGGTSPSSGDLASDVDLTLGTWVALDLASGVVAPVSGTVDPADPQWRGQRVLFRQIPAGEATIGRAVADVTAEDDEHPQRHLPVSRVWIAAHELSQGQWLTLAGTRPWLSVLPVSDPFPWIGVDLPAFGLSPRLAEMALSRWGGDGWLLDLPEAEEWERACLAGGSGKFAWGDSLDGAAGWAVCDSLHPQPIGGRQGNAWGLYDMHGNVWELVRDGLAWQVRGGAWDQPVVTARASNQLAVGAETIGWNVGLRPVLRR